MVQSPADTVAEGEVEFVMPLDKHLPTFQHDAAPLIEQGDASPRMKDEVWSVYESQSES